MAFWVLLPFFSSAFETSAFLQFNFLLPQLSHCAILPAPVKPGHRSTWKELRAAGQKDGNRQWDILEASEVTSLPQPSLATNQSPALQCFQETSHFSFFPLYPTTISLVRPSLHAHGLLVTSLYRGSFSLDSLHGIRENILQYASDHIKLYLSPSMTYLCLGKNATSSTCQDLDAAWSTRLISHCTSDHVLLSS